MHTYTHKYMYVYLYEYVCMSVCCYYDTEAAEQAWKWAALNTSAPQLLPLRVSSSKAQELQALPQRSGAGTPQLLHAVAKESLLAKILEPMGAMHFAQEEAAAEASGVAGNAG